VTRVLVVDDEPQILRALRINLHARQYDVVTAGTGRGALAAASDAHPDLVVLDLGLPDMDGVDVIRSLRKWTEVPIVILSGRMNSAAKVDALDAGADDYVTKPFSVEELLARIRAVTRRTTEPELVEPVQLGRWTVDLSDHVIYETLPANVGAGDAQVDSSSDIDGPGPQVHLTPTE
jgi:two-component system, OmpR family, KDP operon response regulator KdpE